MTIALRIDEIPWINSHLGIGCVLDYEQMKPILCFSLIWNLFETETCKCNANLESIRKNVDHANISGGLSAEKYEPFIHYFRKQYLGDKQTFVDFFDRLMLSDKKKEKEAKEIVIRAFSNDAENVSVIVYALLIIAYRIRNNFYHGNKKVPELPRQTELFTTINALLMTYLEDIQNLPS
jgi:hypothetical protein